MARLVCMTIGRLMRFLHCLFTLHRAVTLYGKRGETIALVCDCGIAYWHDASQIELRD